MKTEDLEECSCNMTSFHGVLKIFVVVVLDVRNILCGQQTRQEVCCKRKGRDAYIH